MIMVLKYKLRKVITDCLEIDDNGLICLLVSLTEQLDVNTFSRIE